MDTAMKTTPANAIQRIEGHPIKACYVGTNAAARLADFASQHLGRSCLLVADENTLAAGGDKAVSATRGDAGTSCIRESRPRGDRGRWTTIPQNPPFCARLPSATAPSGIASARHEKPREQSGLLCLWVATLRFGCGAAALGTMRPRRGGSSRELSLIHISEPTRPY